MKAIQLIACASLCFGPRMGECGGKRGLRGEDGRRLTEENTPGQSLPSSNPDETNATHEEEQAHSGEGSSTATSDGIQEGIIPPLSNEKSAVAVADVQIPINVQYGFVDVRKPFEKAMSTPLFWNIPKAGGHPVKGYLSECMHLVEALDIGGQGEHAEDTILEVVSEQSGFQYVNVDTFSRPGLAKAKAMGLGPSKLADVIFTMWPHEASELFQGEQKGALFALFRHPIQRARSMFRNLQQSREDLKSMTMAEYVQSPYVEENWMVRMLVNKMSGPLDPVDVDLAKRVVEEKIIVGLTSKMVESYHHFDQYFKWQGAVPDLVDCREVYAELGNNYNKEIQEGSEEWNLLLGHNTKDMELYAYIEDLFHNEQASRLFGADLKAS